MIFSEFHRRIPIIFSFIFIVNPGGMAVILAKIRLFDRNLRGEKQSFQPHQPGGKLFWETTKLFTERNTLKQDFFFFLFVA